MRINPLIPPKIIAILSVVTAQFTLGKKTAFPLGLVMGLSAYEIGVVVLLCEVVLMSVILYMIEYSADRFRLTCYLRNRSEKVQTNMEERVWVSRLMKIGWLAPLVITAVPFMGGVWSGMALSKVMGLSLRKSLWSVGMGAVVGCAIFVLTALGVLSLVDLSTT